MAAWHYFKRLLLILLAVAFVIFSAVNRDVVAVNLVAYHAQLPLFLFALLCFTLGALAAGIRASLQLAKNKHLYRKEHKLVMALKNELQGLQVERENSLPAPVPPQQ